LDLVPARRARRILDRRQPLGVRERLTGRGGVERDTSRTIPGLSDPGRTRRRFEASQHMRDLSAKKLFPNPFYVVLLLASTLFVLTTLLYLVSATVQERAGRAGVAPKPGSLAFAGWFDRNGGLALGVEFVVMLVCGLLAMATDRWFPERAARAERHD